MSNRVEFALAQWPFLGRLRQAMRRFGRTCPGRVLHCLFVRKRSFITWFAIMFAWLALGVWIGQHTPVVPMEALQRHTGVVLAVRSNRRATCRSEMQVRSDDGETRWWMGCFYGRDEFSALVGQRIVFLTQYHFSEWFPLPPWYYEEIRHLVTEQGKVLMDYRVNRQKSLKYKRPDGPGWQLFRFYVYLGIFFGAWVLLWCGRDLLREGRCSSTDADKEEQGNGHG